MPPRSPSGWPSWPSASRPAWSPTWQARKSTPWPSWSTATSARSASGGRWSRCTFQARPPERSGTGRTWPPIAPSASGRGKNSWPAAHTVHDHLGSRARSRPGGWGLGLGYLARVALSQWTLTVVTPGAGMAQNPPYQVTDPATGEVTETFPFATDVEVAEALAAATDAFAAWRQRPVAERAAVVKRVGGLFTERAADLAALITKEMGKRPAQAVGEAEFCTDIFNYYADNGPQLIADKPLPGHDTARVEYRPVGP